MNISIDVKKRVESLLIKLPINNSASSIVEKFYSGLLKENNITPLNEAIYLNSLTQQLKSHAWIPEVNDFIVESEFVINENSSYINILSVYENLKKMKGSEFYIQAIKSLEELSNSEICLESVEKIAPYTWVPQIKNLYSFLKENINGVDSSNPNFIVSNIISPILPVSENKFRFYSSGKILELDTTSGSLTESFDKNSLKFENLVECVKFFGINKSNFILGIRNKKIQVDLNESKVQIENKEIELDKINSFLNNSIGLSTANERKQIQLLETLTSNFGEFIVIDESVKIVPVKESNSSYTIFRFNDNLYGQFLNPIMNENSLTVFESVSDILNDIKAKLNYDASSSLGELVKKEQEVSQKNESLQKSLQLKIGKIQDKKNKFIAEAKSQDILNHPKIQETISLLESEITSLLEDITPISEKVNIKIKNDNNKYSCFLSELISESVIKVNTVVNNFNQVSRISRDMIEIV